MTEIQPRSPLSAAKLDNLMGYVADLEVEVDRLRRRDQFLQKEVRGVLERIGLLCEAGRAEPGTPLAEIDALASGLVEVLRDLHESPGFHPAYDQVVPIALRPLVEQVFHAQLRLEAAPAAELQLDFEEDHVEWFPARLRHLLDNLISNSLRFRDPAKEKSWVRVAFRRRPEGYEFQVTDNGLGLPPGRDGVLFDLFYRAASVRRAAFGVGLATVKRLVEQSAGSIDIHSGQRQGTSVTLLLPCYEIDDFLT